MLLLYSVFPGFRFSTGVLKGTKWLWVVVMMILNTNEDRVVFRELEHDTGSYFHRWCRPSAVSLGGITTSNSYDRLPRYDTFSHQCLPNERVFLHLEFVTPLPGMNHCLLIRLSVGQFCEGQHNKTQKRGMQRKSQKNEFICFRLWL